MADDSTAVPPTVAPAADAEEVLRYVADMLVELAQLASGAGDSALAASLAIAAIQAAARFTGS